jgi:TPR repeat protein
MFQKKYLRMSYWVFAIAIALAHFGCAFATATDDRRVWVLPDVLFPPVSAAAAAANDPAEQNEFGLRYFYGRGRPKNDKLAKYWFKRAAKQRNARGQRNYALLLGKNSNVGYQIKAARYCKLAADHGDVVAQICYGNLLSGLSYEDLSSIDRAIATELGASLGCTIPELCLYAVYYYKLAADQDNAVAQYALGILYCVGHVIAQDKELGAAYVKLAADQGHRMAQYEYAEYLERGWVVPQNNEDAALYRARAKDKSARRPDADLYKNPS